MTTPIKISYHITENSGGSLAFNMRPYHYIYYSDDNYKFNISGVGIDPISPDPGNEIFATVADALEHYRTAENGMAFRIQALNTDRLTDFVPGDLTEDVPDLQIIVDAIIENKQDHSENLDFFSEVEPNEHVEEMMAHEGKGDLQAYLELGTAAFLDAGDLASAFDLSNKVDKVTGKGLSTEDFTSALLTKLNGIATAATANDTDANLKARANHTGSQTASTISDFTAASRAAFRGYDGTTLKGGIFPIFKSATVASGSVVYHLTDNGSSGGNALFPNGNVYLDGLQLRAQEGSTPHAFGTPALSNSNKTLTIPVSKIAPILGILNLNQAADGTVVKAIIWGD